VRIVFKQLPRIPHSQFESILLHVRAKSAPFEYI
jgi:hypothetical protein